MVSKVKGYEVVVRVDTEEDAYYVYKEIRSRLDCDVVAYEVSKVGEV